jgi:hypothetical protein
MRTILPTVAEQRPTLVRLGGKNRRPIRFCFAVVVLLLGLELIARLELANSHSFWNGVDSSNKPVDVLFIGSSRVAAAIDPQAFAEAIPDRHLNVVNAGAGYATAAEFHLALRNTFREHPDRLRSAVIFIEAPCAMPDSTSWSDPWSNPARPEMLTPLLRWEDVERYWTDVRGETFAVRFEERLHLLFDYTFRFSRLITDRLALGERVTEVAEWPVKRPLKSLVRSENTESRADLSSAGGIRTDVEGVALARQRAYQYMKDALHDQKSVDWNASIIADTVKLAKENGARVVFFDLPIHSAHKAVFETATRQADRAALKNVIQTWNTPFVSADFSATDDDFPDIWHLRKSRAADFSRALATASREFLKSN